MARDAAFSASCRLRKCVKVCHTRRKVCQVLQYLKGGLRCRTDIPLHTMAAKVSSSPSSSFRANIFDNLAQG